MKISYVIPVFNEQDSIAQLYDEIIANNPQGYEYEFVFVDDGSNDNSYEILERIAQTDNQVTVVKFRRNFGKAAAMQSAFEQVQGDIIITLDADLQDDPSEIINFVEKIEQGYDLVSGWKKERQDPKSKTIPSKMFNYVTSRSFHMKLHDFNCGYKAYKKELVKELDIYGEMHRYIPALAYAKGFKVTEIPVKHRARQYGRSKYGKERYLRGFLDLLTVKLVTNYIISPLYLFGKIGVSFFSIGFLIGLYLTIMKFGFGVPLYNRPLLFLSVLLIMVGLQFFSIGLLGELIVNQNRKANKHRRVSVEKIISTSKYIQRRRDEEPDQ